MVLPLLLLLLLSVYTFPYCCCCGLPNIIHREPKSPNGSAVVEEVARKKATLDRDQQQAGKRPGKAPQRGKPKQLGGEIERSGLSYLFCCCILIPCPSVPFGFIR